MNIRVEKYDDGQVVYVALDPDGVWARSDFPDELITVDYDEEGKPIGIEVIGPAAEQFTTDVIELIARSGVEATPQKIRTAVGA